MGKGKNYSRISYGILYGIENLLTTNSYTSAIQVALTTLGLHPGDEVITSPMSCLASINLYKHLD